MSESRIVVETDCKCRMSHHPFCDGVEQRYIDPENLPAEVIEAAAIAVELHGVYDHSESVGKAALSAAFRTLIESDGYD